MELIGIKESVSQQNLISFSQIESVQDKVPYLTLDRRETSLIYSEFFPLRSFSEFLFSQSDSQLVRCESLTPSHSHVPPQGADKMTSPEEMLHAKQQPQPPRLQACRVQP